MGVNYQTVGWNPQKKAYDRVMLGGVVVYLLLFIGLGLALHPDATAETLLIRGLGSCAFLLLHIVLSIGPLCRLDSRFLPLLYNRRHLGVATFGVGLLHGGFSLVQFHALGDINPLVSLFAGNTRFDSVAQFPFQPLGAFALGILFLMAATSHDFWLANLTAPVWKALHMLVYVAYGLLVMHVSLGILQAETSLLWSAAVVLGAAWVVGLHLFTGFRERTKDRGLAAPEVEWTDVCEVGDIPMNRARVVTLAGERVAIYRYGDKLSAVSSVCQHQNGPLGEGRVIDGCITCPWHGYQYEPHTGRSPAPFTEKVPTFRVRVDGGRVLVDARPLPAGTEVAPAMCASDCTQAEEAGR
ncbi:MAG: sulfoxide reductase heme-binding subunit YedZ [Planctomycetota bacterium]|jgi:sulfoxide reductase heme-binding subunit YedZ